MAVCEYKITTTPPSEEASVQRWNAATKAFLDQVQSFLPELRADELEVMTGAIHQVHYEPTPSSTELALALKLTGREYTQSEKLQLEITSLFRLFAKRRELLQGALTTTQVATLLGTTRQTPHDRVEKGSLFAVLDKGIWKFPSWQFDPEGPDGVIEGLPEVLSALSGSSFSKLNWLASPNCDLNGLTPVEALKQGQKANVLQEAQAVGVW